MFPADRQLVGNSSMIPPWAYGFFWTGDLLGVCGWFSICMVWVGTHTREMNDVAGRAAVQSSLLIKHCRVEASPGKA